MGSGRWVLVDPTPDGRLAAIAGDLSEVLRGGPDGTGPSAVLTRPDGYLAWASESPDPDVEDLAALRRCALT